MKHRGKARIRLLKTHRKTTELLEMTKEMLHQMTPLVHLHVVCNGLDAMRSGGNHRRHTPIFQLVAQGVAVVSSLCNQRLELDTSKQGVNADQIMALARKQHEIHQVAKGVDHHADLGAWPPPRERAMAWLRVPLWPRHRVGGAARWCRR